MAVAACVAVFGQERGREVHELVERIVGGPCPCLGDGTCPLLGELAQVRQLVAVSAAG